MRYLVVILFIAMSLAAYSQPPVLCKDGSPANSISIQLPVTFSSTCTTGFMSV